MIETRVECFWEYEGGEVYGCMVGRDTAEQVTLAILSISSNEGVRIREIIIQRRIGEA